MPIKVLHIMSFDWGGAANAALRLHNGMLEAGIDSKVLLKWKSRKDIKNSFVYTLPAETYTFKKKLNNKVNQYKKKLLGEAPIIDYLKNAPEGFHLFTIPTEKYDITLHPLVQEADIIHLHWVSDFINYNSFFQKVNKPVVWTMHDMNPFTGGCHYAMDCLKYEDKCLNCPQLAGTINCDYALYIEELKIKSLLNVKGLNIVTPSQWLSDCSKKSQILKNFPHHVIHYGLDTNLFKRRNKEFSRDLLGLPQNKKILLFVSGNVDCKPKGYYMLKQAFEKISDNSDVILCAIGDIVEKVKKTNIIELGAISDERLMSIVYAAADIFITPSLADNSPNTIIESLLCGTPVIGFPIGGISRMINHKNNGLLCSMPNTESLIESILYFLNNSELFDNNIIAEDARKKYDIINIILQYKSLYESVLFSSKE